MVQKKTFEEIMEKIFQILVKKKKHTQISDPVSLVTMEIREYFELNDNKTQHVKCVRYS